MRKKEIKIALITGYLGAGKTTLLNYVLGNQEGIRAAVIVNDIGEVNVDASLIAKTGKVSEQDKNLIPLTNGCICCTLKANLAEQLTKLAESGKFNYIIIEASGICEPMPIAQTITEICRENSDDGIPMRLDNIIAVIDCARMLDEFENGHALVAEDIGEDDIENLLIQQLEFCNTILLNKADTISENEMKELKAVVRKLQPEAHMIETNYGQVSLKDILDTGRFDLDKAAASAGWVAAIENTEEEKPETEEYGISSFVYSRRQPFSREKFMAFTKAWPKEIIRCKGMVWYREDPNMSYIFEQAGRLIQEKMEGRFIASGSKEQVKMMLRRYPQLKKVWDPKYGDRMQKLVFIGRQMDRKAIEDGLDSCLTE